MEGYDAMWFVAVVVGTVVLGAAIAFGMMHARRRSGAERIAAERRTRANYRAEDLADRR